MILYTAVMVVAFMVSGLMLYGRTRIIFRAPVPSIHRVVGISIGFIGVSYVLYLPYLYMLSIAHPTADTVYMVSCVLANALLFAAMIWITVTHIRVLREQYSTIHRTMFVGIGLLWGVGLFSVVIYLLAIWYQTIAWSFIDMTMNLASMAVCIYISEHIVPPMPKEQVVETEESEPSLETGTDRPLPDYTQLLVSECERKRLFCNPELSLGELALALGTNRTYLSKYFADHDTTFYNYINTLRTTYAAELLRTTDQSVIDIYTAAGFTSKATFRKYFTQLFGCTPTEYREQGK